MPHPPLKAAPTRLENDCYVVEIDSFHGGVSRIFDKDLQKDLLDTSVRCGNELRSPAQPAATSTESAAEIELVESGPVRATARITSKVGEVPYVCAISLYRDLRRLDFNLTLDYGKGLRFGSRRSGISLPNFPDMTGAKVVPTDGTGLYALFPLSFTGQVSINQ
ncbi:MAG: hypothetical protein LBH76_03240, partial [Propionibacteriaceae bacterium]|nr:hypothetical protein [Propionibacteriaceae bacterium]